MKTFMIGISLLGLVSPLPQSVSVDKILDPAEEFIKETTAVPTHEFADWNDWESWVPPEKIVKLAPFYKAGYDFDGSPVYVIEYGEWNYRELAKLSEDELKEFDKYSERNVRCMSKDAAANNGQGIAVVCDFDGFALKTFASSKAITLALKSFTTLVRIHDAMKYGIHINTNFAAETFLNVARPFMGSLFEKIEVHGTRKEKWMPVLLSKVPQGQLPPQYGGTKDWKPLPLG